jgi:hypothetical protein
MTSVYNKLWLAIAATVFVFAGCEKEELRSTSEDDFNINDYSFVINADMATDPETRLVPVSGAWENGDQIYISLDGDDANVYMLKYDAASGVWGVYNIPGANNFGFHASGTLTALYCSKPSLSMSGGKLCGNTLGDVVYTKSGSYTKAGKVITVSISLNQRPVSILKIQGAGGSCYVENMTNTHSVLTSLNDMTWDSEQSKYSYVYDSANDVSWCYGDLPAGGTVRIRYSGGDRAVFTRTYSGKTLESGKMATLQGPATIQNTYWTEDDSEYYTTGTVITYQQPRNTNPYTVVVIGDGFTKYDFRQNGAFETAARQSMDYLFSIEPYNHIQDLFNVYFICAQSDERGAYIKSRDTQEKQTYFGVSWTSDKSYSDMDVQNTNLMRNFVSSNCPDFQEGRISSFTKCAILVLVNENVYAGLCYPGYDGAAYCLLPVMNRSLGWSNQEGVTKSTGTYLNLVAHEFGGHAIGRLGDEYYKESVYSGSTISDHSWPAKFSLNLTANDSSYPWSWMPGEGYTNEGLYEGGYASYSTGIWRPEIISCMYDNRPYFNAWSRYLIMQRVYSVCGESFSQSQFLAVDSGKSIWNGPALHSSPVLRGNTEDIEEVPMLPAPVFK